MRLSTPLLIALVALIAVPVVIAVVPPATDFSADNPFWNGYSTMVGELHALVVREGLANVLPGDPVGTVVVTVAYTPYSDEELRALRDYVVNGGTLILLDDHSGHANQVLEYLGAPIRIVNGSMLMDPVFNYKSPKMPKVIKLEGSLEGLKELYLNYASIVEVAGDEGVDVLAWSSAMAYLDENLNGMWDEGEPKGPFPVIASVSLGGGRLIVASDPSMLINCMIGLGDNLEALKRLTGGSKLIIYDQSHVPKSLHEALRDRVLAVRDVLASSYALPGLLAILIYLAIRQAGGARI